LTFAATRTSTTPRSDTGHPPGADPVFDAQFARFWRELLGAGPFRSTLHARQHSQRTTAADVSKKKTEKRQEPTGTEDEKDIFHISEGEEEQNVAEEQEYEAEPDDIMLFSAREQLRKKDFSQCSQMRSPKPGALSRG
jgi:uncharacterized protein with von Willebrand factor type A (vWA) domain